MGASSPLEIDRAPLEALSALLLERAGLNIPPENFGMLRSALEGRLNERGLRDPEAYVRALRAKDGEAELRALLPWVTVGKTDFFRDDRQFAALEKVLLPKALAAARGEGRALRIWSAGCATGEEPYSLAMVLTELGASEREAKVWATDLNHESLAKAEAGLYPQRRMAGVSEKRRGRFFTEAGNTFQIREELKGRIRFFRHNLAEPTWSDIPRGEFDFILCRNVIIYFDLETIRRVIEGFHEVLRPDGLLLLGYSESLYRVPNRFEMVELDGAFGYRPVHGASVREPRRPEPPPRPPPLRRPTGSAIPALTKTPPPGSIKPTPLPTPLPTPVPIEPKPEPPPLGDPLARAVQLLDSGAFVGSRALLEELMVKGPFRVDVALTLGNLYGLLAEPVRARALFDSVLSRDPLICEAHLFLSLALIQVGRLDEAKAELSRALFLEPTVAIGHYLLAQTLERQGDSVGARRSYRNAIAQLRHPQRALVGYYPDLPEREVVERASRYALAALEEQQRIW